MTWARVLAATLLVQGTAPDPQRLPDREPFFAAVRQNLERAQNAQREFAYTERRTELSFNPFGRLGTSGTRVFDVAPNPDGSIARRLLEKDGKPVADAPLERISRRAPRGRSMVDDVVATLDLTIDHREMLDGRPAIVLTFKPKPDARPQTREGRIARSFTGRIWIDEQAAEVAKVDAVAVDSISFGYGLIAHMNEGSTVTAVRRAVDRDIWLPVSVRFSGEGRALLFRKLTINFAVDWFNYRRSYSSSP